MPIRPILVAALTTLPLVACAPAVEREREIRAPQISVVGPAESCVTLSQIDRTVVHDDYTIDFVMLNNTRYRNTLPHRCFSLGFEESFAYSVSTGRLCNVDTITVLHSDGSTGTTCGLGEFLPVELLENN